MPCRALKSTNRPTKNSLPPGKQRNVQHHTPPLQPLQRGQQRLPPHLGLRVGSHGSAVIKTTDVRVPLLPLLLLRCSGTVRHHPRRSEAVKGRFLSTQRWRLTLDTVLEQPRQTISPKARPVRVATHKFVCRFCELTNAVLVTAVTGYTCTRWSRKRTFDQE